jgi:hypothetical protein
LVANNKEHTTASNSIHHEEISAAVQQKGRIKTGFRLRHPSDFERWGFRRRTTATRRHPEERSDEGSLFAFLRASILLCRGGKSAALDFLCALCAPISAPSALNLSAVLFASFHHCLYQCSSAFISGDLDLPPTAPNF